jgi:hypothetical protein
MQQAPLVGGLQADQWQSPQRLVAGAERLQGQIQ